jgi:Protein of unknown function (DUF3987)
MPKIDNESILPDSIQKRKQLIGSKPSTNGLPSGDASPSPEKKNMTEGEAAIEMSLAAWGDLVLIDRVGDLPTFPAGCLPRVLDDWTMAVAENSQTPVDLAAMISLSAVAVTVAKRAVIQPYPTNPSYPEPANLWTCVPQPSGTRKTFVVEQAKAPFNAFLTENGKKRGQEIVVRKQELAALKRQKDDLTDKLSKLNVGGNDYKKAKAVLTSCLERIGNIDVRVPRFFADDITPERLAVLMGKHDGRIAILSDEGGCFDHFAGIYNKRPNIDVYLHGHSGGTILRDRQTTGEEIRVEKAALTIGVSPQPQVIQGMSNKDRLQGRGLLARFLWSLPRSTLGGREWEPGPITSEVQESYRKALNHLLNWEVKTPEVVKLSQDAYHLWIARARELGQDCTRLPRLRTAPRGGVRRP